MKEYKGIKKNVTISVPKRVESVTFFKITAIYAAGRDGRRPSQKKKLRVSGALVSNLVLTQQSAAEAGVHSRFHVYEVSGIEEVLAAHDLAQSFEVQFLELLVVYAQ